MLEICQINISNFTINQFNKLVSDMKIVGLEIVINDGKFYVQRISTL